MNQQALEARVAELEQKVRFLLHTISEIEFQRGASLSPYDYRRFLEKEAANHPSVSEVQDW